VIVAISCYSPLVIGTPMITLDGFLFVSAIWLNVLVLSHRPPLFFRALQTYWTEVKFNLCPVIRLHGEINDEFVENLQQALKRVKAQQFSHFYLLIDSEGGKLHQSMECLDLLESCGCPYTTIAGEHCHSAANLIFLSAPKRLTQQSTIFGFHSVRFETSLEIVYSPTNILEGTDVLEREIQRLKEIYLTHGHMFQEISTKYYADRLGLTQSEVQEFLMADDGSDTLLDSEKALELGVATKCITALPTIWNQHLF